jgi:hypothetical protein
MLHIVLNVISFYASFVLLKFYDIEVKEIQIVETCNELIYINVQIEAAFICCNLELNILAM